MQIKRVMDIVKVATLMNGTDVAITSQGRYDNRIHVETLEKLAFQYYRAYGARIPRRRTPARRPRPGVRTSGP